MFTRSTSKLFPRTTTFIHTSHSSQPIRLPSAPFSTSISQSDSSTRTEVLSLYRSLLRASRLFETYNYREYVRRRAKDAFKQHATETDAQRIKELVAKGKQDLKVAQRQGWINRAYATGEKTVMELEGRSN